MEPAPGHTTEAPAWSESDLSASPHQRADKPERVRRMFAAIAGSYDLNNRVHSFGRDQAWRKVAVRMAEPAASDRVLDAACGTGDLSRAFLDAGVEHVTGLDFTSEMLHIARTKRLHRKGESDPRIDYVEGDAMALDLPDASFDVVSIAFGIRNVADPSRALREFRRVLRPGGRLIVLEFDRPRNPLIRAGNTLYQRVIMPRTATLLSGDRSGAYRYLPRSIDTFLDREALAEAMREAGFAPVRQRALTFGVCICSLGHVQ